LIGKQECHEVDSKMVSEMKCVIVVGCRAPSMTVTVHLA
jgi:hypothetical protein